MLDIWMGQGVEKGEYVTDKRIMFKRSSVINEALLKELEDVSRRGTLNIATQVKAHNVFKLCKKDIAQILDFDSFTRYKELKDGGMIFVDCFRDEWKIQTRYYDLTKQLLDFDYLLGNSDIRSVGFVKDNEIICVLMCFD